MESNGEDVSARIIREIETLKSAKSDIERRISDLEAQLREIGTKNDVSGSCSPTTSTVTSGVGHGLSPDMIYRYSRHLLLPTFGVQGFQWHSVCIYNICVCIYKFSEMAA